MNVNPNIKHDIGTLAMDGGICAFEVGCARACNAPSHSCVGTRRLIPYFSDGF